MVATAEVLWKLGERTTNMMQQFRLLRAAIDQPQELQVLDAIYTSMPKRNFFSHVLARVPERLGVLEMRDVIWSDWDHPEQIGRTLREAVLRAIGPDVSLPALQAG